MRTFVIFPRSIAELQDASTPKIAMKRYLKAHPELQQSDIMVVQSNWIYDGRTEEREVTEVKEQGVVITETLKPANSPICAGKVEFVSDKQADELIKNHNLKILGPEDSKPEHTDVN